MFDAEPSIKRHSFSFSPFTSTRAVQQITALLGRDVLFIKRISESPIILTYQINVQLASKLTSPSSVAGVRLLWTSASVTLLTEITAHNTHSENYLGVTSDWRTPGHLAVSLMSQTHQKQTLRRAIPLVT